jgi:RimJ/RimL family protein N-acetyltransferase
MILKNITKDDSSTIEQWLKDDLAGHQFIAEYKSTDQMFKLLGTNRKFWLVYNNEVAIGFIDLEINDEKGYFSFYVAPRFRTKGFSTELLNLLQREAGGYSVKSLFGYVELENIASIKSLRKAGYLQSKTLDKDGLLEFSKELH